MRELAKVVNIPPSMFYYYFTDKHQFTVAIATNIMASFIDQDGLSIADIRSQFLKYFIKNLNIFKVFYLDFELNFSFSDIANTVGNEDYDYDDEFFINEIAELILMCKK